MPGGPDTPGGFQAVQHRFAAHLRDPERCPAPKDVEERRMAVYRDLFFRNVEGFMAGCFPVLRSITPEPQWLALIRDYFARHEAHTPLFPKMPQEFLQYLEQERGEAAGDPPFLRELAYYEWVELALSIDTREIDDEKVDPEGDLLAGEPVLSPLAWPLAFRFPVHRIGPEFLPEAAPGQPTYLVVFRDRADKVGFIELNPVSARLLDLLQKEGGQSARALLERIARELGHADPEVVVRGGLEIMQRLRARDVILGVRA